MKNEIQEFIKQVDRQAANKQIRLKPEIAAAAKDFIAKEIEHRVLRGRNSRKNAVLLTDKKAEANRKYVREHRERKAREELIE
jgi:hypothetical protein